MTRTFTRWAEFHRANPQVFDLFRRFALEARREHRGQFGARLIGERIRWYTQVETQSADGFKLNDHYWPYYARLLMAIHPEEFAKFFELRGGLDVNEDEISTAHYQGFVPSVWEQPAECVPGGCVTAAVQMGRRAVRRWFERDPLLG